MQLNVSSSVEFPVGHGAAKRVRGVPGYVAGAHVGTAAGTTGGTPHGATKRVRCAKISGGGACGLRHWGLRWNSLWGHRTCERRAEVGGGD
eukprot:4598942-Pyramimonas_sp.AAC.1